MRHNLLLLFLLLPCAAYADKPFFAFAAAWDPEAVELVARAFDKEDYVSESVARGMKNQIKAKTFALPASLESVARAAAKACVPGAREELIIYNPEHWEATPKPEIDDLPRSIGEAGRTTKASGCRTLGVAPDGILVGLPPGQCRGDPSALARQVDWRQVDVVLLQAQRLLSDNCGGKKAVREYAKFVEEWANQVRAVNPKTKIIGQFSFRYTDAETMIQAIEKTNKIVDGYYLAYPAATSGIECRYCSADNLRQVLSRYRSIER